MRNRSAEARTFIKENYSNIRTKDLVEMAAKKFDLSEKTTMNIYNECTEENRYRVAMEKERRAREAAENRKAKYIKNPELFYKGRERQKFYFDDSKL